MNSIEKTWRNFLKECINNGEWVTKDDGDEILEITDNHAFITNVADEVVMQGQAFNLDIFLKLIGGENKLEPRLCFGAFLACNFKFRKHIRKALRILCLRYVGKDT